MPYIRHFKCEMIFRALLNMGYDKNSAKRFMNNEMLNSMSDTTSAQNAQLEALKVELKNSFGEIFGKLVQDFSN